MQSENKMPAVYLFFSFFASDVFVFRRRENGVGGVKLAMLPCFLAGALLAVSGIVCGRAGAVFWRVCA